MKQIEEFIRERGFSSVPREPSRQDACVGGSMMDGLVEVSKEEFFARLYADARDIMPKHDDPNHTVWETRRQEVFGVTLPGWKDGGNPNIRKAYALARQTD